MERQQSTQLSLSAQRGQENGFRGPQVCGIVGITYRQLDYWARTDLLRPSISDARGSGTQRVYSYTDLLQLKVIKQLLDAGVSLRSTRKAIECLRASGSGVASASLVIADDRSVLAYSGEELFDLLHGGQGVLSIVLGMERIVSEVDAAITEITGALPEKRGLSPDRATAESASAESAHPASATPESATTQSNSNGGPVGRKAELAR
ncbi:MAG TPA: MerR family transcriptional regulator [Acidimicrobiales bacterium]|nr:MerR family transcriptional regulator [Acidimicrobiales bacterium]